MKKTITLASLALALATPALAQQALTTGWVNLRAGPSRDYPLVMRLPPNTPIQVEGCLSGYNWCDVSVGPDRGWAYARQLSYVYQDRPVPIYGWGARIGLPIIVFSIGSYWDDYYRQRPW
ncbi:SH3 domain-containing protein, partial [Pelomonas sp. KK5]|uniref:SH3 domain-containing protein n=1 Tax=Pelomonas sp. KK5 TaxID=1855730 RepID=UPI001301CB3E